MPSAPPMAESVMHSTKDLRTIRARDPSIRARASDSPDSRTPPAGRIQRQSEAASVHPHIRREGLLLLRRQEPDAAFAAPTVASRLVPYRERGWRANYEIPPSAWLRASWDPLPDELFRAGRGSCSAAFSALTSDRCIAW